MPQAEVNGTTLHYRLEGPEAGPVIMMAHSLLTTLHMWDSQISALTEAGFRVLRYDSRGHGQSAVPEGPYSIDMLADDAIGLMDSLGFDQAHFCGLSKSGMVGQNLGARFGNRLISLILCDTASQVPPPSKWDERIATVCAQGMLGFADATIDRWFTKPVQQRLPDQVAAVRKLIVTTPVEGFCACSEAMRDMDQRETIRKIATPTLVIVGEHDSVTPVEAARFIHERIAGSRLVIISDAAHFSNIEQPGPFNEALLEFLRAQGGVSK